ncbi:hypothetical protein LTR99_000162 [Exophiala xenobiotica]|uniref:Altered inheritance of mitochondria protein 41 n=1 Tax=Vermiconidia calcicola TaxID=1690605 RepID=A0AAV9PWF0_9PEZI|nr:hypothetical protein H2202_008504 [Exophiala xenobiotica]KAK5530031.1 hypothetical protein LTR25_009275 [Vermiconidia calcicola]KAK5547350.1 hypothetical protein LTR23_002570 [Chaetothyriales sp. CCFEE 6169]KAK5190894.1 hypothetical protein LTR92_009104 [Exophiala xenobiotica]KAK5206957.1 hypothetical protein LTR41_007492 [Exophiala xenobiotica]
MSMPRTFRLLASQAERPLCSRCLYRSGLPRQSLRWNSSSSSAAPTPVPLLSKLKQDLKAAMRAKDQARLTVIRGTISEINQAASSSSPVQTDMQILALLRKRRSSSTDARQEAVDAKRPDLLEKLDKEIEVVDELMGTVEMMPVSEMRSIVRGLVESLKGAGPGEQTPTGELKPGPVMKELLKPGGPLDGKPLDKKVLAELVREECFSNHGTS